MNFTKQFCCENIPSPANTAERLTETNYLIIITRR